MMMNKVADVKKVVKKVTAPAAVAPVVASTPAPAASAVAAEPVKKVTKRASSTASASSAASATSAASTTTATTAASVTAPVVPALTETVEVAVDSTTLADEIATLRANLTALRDGAAAALVVLKRVEKRATQEVKEARKNRKRTRTEPADGEPRKPSNFEIPVPISDELSGFLGGGKANSMSRAQVTKAINAYVNEKKLRTKHDIAPDAALRKLLSVDDSVKLTIFNMQTYLGRHYLKPVAKATV